MQLARVRADAQRDNEDFATVFRSNAGLDAILFGFFDGEARVFVESWVSCAPGCSPQLHADLERTALMRMATFAAMTAGDDARAQAERRPNGGTSPIRLRLGRYDVWLGRPIAGLYPVMAFQRGEEATSAERRALLRVGMAYVSQSLTRHVYDRPVWSDDLVEATLKMLSIEFFVVTASGEIHFDGRSEQPRDDRYGWLVHNGRLTLREEKERGALREAISGATSDAHRASIIAVTVGPGQVRLATVAPLGQGGKASAIVLFESPHTDHFALREHFFRAYDLTRSECNVAHELLNGKTPAETAEETGLSLSTVRSYLKNIFEKTGAHRQSELISLYYTSILPVGKKIARANRHAMN